MEASFMHSRTRRGRLTPAYVVPAALLSGDPGFLPVVPAALLSGDPGFDWYKAVLALDLSKQPIQLIRKPLPIRVIQRRRPARLHPGLAQLLHEIARRQALAHVLRRE